MNSKYFTYISTDCRDCRCEVRNEHRKSGFFAMTNSPTRLMKHSNTAWYGRTVPCLGPICIILHDSAIRCPLTTDCTLHPAHRIPHFKLIWTPGKIYFSPYYLGYIRNTTHINSACHHFSFYQTICVVMWYIDFVNVISEFHYVNYDICNISIWT